jgi:subtilisin
MSLPFPTPKQFYRISFFALAVSIFISCTSDDEAVKTNPIDDCLNTSSLNNNKVIEGEYIASVRQNTSGRSLNFSQLLKRNGIETATIHSESPSFYKVALSKTDAAALRQDTSVKHVEQDRIIAACGCFTVVDPGTVTWNVNQVGYGNGEGKTAWIIDSGVQGDHPDLNVNENLSRSFIEGESSLEDENGHGTHVAGIIGAINNNIGTLGVASGATLVSLKVLGANGEGKLSNMLYALDYINQHAHAGDVVNISISFQSVSEILEERIKEIANRGIYFALAAGNDSSDANNYSPGRTSGKNIYTVSAVDSLNRIASFSNFGNEVIDFAAPGVQIPSTFKGSGYAILSGTSQAAPHVAGLLLIGNGKIDFNGEALSDPDGVGDRLAHK